MEKCYKMRRLLGTPTALHMAFRNPSYLSSAGISFAGMGRAIWNPCA